MDGDKQTDRQAGRQAGRAPTIDLLTGTDLKSCYIRLHSWAAGALRESRKRREFKTTDVRITLGSNYRSNPAQ